MTLREREAEEVSMFTEFSVDGMDGKKGQSGYIPVVHHKLSNYARVKGHCCRGVYTHDTGRTQLSDDLDSTPWPATFLLYKQPHSHHPSPAPPTHGHTHCQLQPSYRTAAGFTMAKFTMVGRNYINISSMFIEVRWWDMTYTWRVA